MVGGCWFWLGRCIVVNTITENFFLFFVCPCKVQNIIDYEYN
jgi:hypothetical protein